MTRILHVLDHSLPLHSGYAFRTRAILKAQQAEGHEVQAMTGLRQGPAAAPVEELSGLIFHRTPGVARGRRGWREWREIVALTDAIARVCRDWRPEVIHA